MDSFSWEQIPFSRMYDIIRILVKWRTAMKNIMMEDKT